MRRRIDGHLVAVLGTTSAHIAEVDERTRSCAGHNFVHDLRASGRRLHLLQSLHDILLEDRRRICCSEGIRDGALTERRSLTATTACVAEAGTELDRLAIRRKRPSLAGFLREAVRRNEACYATQENTHSIPSRATHVIRSGANRGLCLKLYFNIPSNTG